MPIYEKLLNTSCYKTEKIIPENVNTAFCKQGETKIKLLESTAPESAIAKFINKRGGGIHHIAFEVEDIVAEIKGLREVRFTLINEQPKRGQIISWFAFFIQRMRAACWWSCARR